MNVQLPPCAPPPQTVITSSPSFHRSRAIFKRDGRSTMKEDSRECSPGSLSTCLRDEKPDSARSLQLLLPCGCAAVDWKKLATNSMNDEIRSFFDDLVVVVSEESGHWLPNSQWPGGYGGRSSRATHSGGLKDMHLARVWRGPHNRTVRTRYIVARDIKQCGGALHSFSSYTLAARCWSGPCWLGKLWRPIMARKLKAQSTRPARRPNRGFWLGEGASLQSGGRQDRRRPLDMAWKFGFQEFQGPEAGTSTSRGRGPTLCLHVDLQGRSSRDLLSGCPRPRPHLLCARWCRVVGRLVACGSGWRRGSRPYGPNPRLRPLTTCLPSGKALRQACPKVEKQKMVSISWLCHREWLQGCAIFFGDRVKKNDEECKLFCNFIPCK